MKMLSGKEVIDQLQEFYGLKYNSRKLMYQVNKINQICKKPEFKETICSIFNIDYNIEQDFILHVVQKHCVKKTNNNNEIYNASEFQHLYDNDVVKKIYTFLIDKKLANLLSSFKMNIGRVRKNNF
jgi:hypothetical protein